MNAGIVTIYGLNNYGNRLQNYAVHSFMDKLGVFCDTLVPAQWSITPYRQKLHDQVLKSYISDPILAQTEYPLLTRDIRFEHFDNLHIPQRFLDCDHFDEALASEYDFFITGSDQVWNPTFRNSLGQVENRLLAFAKPAQRVCFAPSIGIDEMEPKWHDLFHREWCKFPYLNVREQSGAALIKQITGRDAEVVLDPTLLIPRSEWESLAEALPGFNEETPYILYYFLGSEEEEIPPQMRAFLDEEIQQKGLKEYRLFCKDDLVTRAVGPAEFLYLFQHASLVCTDSFHATVFSILMDKPFLLCDRQFFVADKPIDMSNRIKTLLLSLELPHRLPGNQLLTQEAVYSTDYTASYRIIDQEKSRMEALMKKTMRLEK